jgi:hypothetical protein
MATQSVARVSFGEARGGHRSAGGSTLSRRVLAISLAIGLAAAAVSLITLYYLVPRLARPAPVSPTSSAIAASQGAPWPSPAPTIRSSEVWYATTPAPGVWAELKVVLDNPVESDATRTTLLVSGSVLEDFRIRSTEPRLLSQPQRRPDGRYAFVFPAPISESLNWYRVFLVCRKSSPRPLQVGFMLDGATSLTDTEPTPTKVFYSDRQADPFLVVPEPLVSWVPGQAQTAFPVLVLYALAMGGVAAAGCVAAFWAIRRQ